MLNRQKTLLYLLQAADRPVLKTELTKWSFLLRNESESAGGSAFYDFVPYRFGPFSFCLYQEAGKLENQGLIATVGSGKSQKWQLTDDADFTAPDSKTARDAQAIVQKFGKRRLNSLIDYVYDGYPKYTYNSEIKQLAKQLRSRAFSFVWKRSRVVAIAVTWLRKSQHLRICPLFIFDRTRHGTHESLDHGDDLSASLKGVPGIGLHGGRDRGG